LACVVPSLSDAMQQVSSARSALGSGETLLRVSLGPFADSLRLLRESEGVDAAWEALILRCRSLRALYPYPIDSNSVESICSESNIRQSEAVQDVLESRVVCTDRVADLCAEFLDQKRAFGSSVERLLYADMPVEMFLQRLVSKRPLVFMNKVDFFVLRDGTTGEDGTKIFDAIGSELQDVRANLEDYLSYEEMEISALIGVSTPTHFINDGSRDNVGVPGNPGSFEPRGVYISQVGARFERIGRMESKHMLICRDQNSQANGYGPMHASFSMPRIYQSYKQPVDKSKKKETQDTEASEDMSLNPLGLLSLACWAKFYGISYFPTYEEVSQRHSQLLKEGKQSSDYVPVRDGGFLNTRVYQVRMEVIAETFLREADWQASKVDKLADCVVVGLGLGVWALDSCQQQLVVNAYANVIRQIPLPHVKRLVFSYFRTQYWPLADMSRKEMETIPVENHEIKVEFLRMNPAEKIESSEFLRVAQYAGDANSFPGNEYWLGGPHLAGSGDPAAAACSTISEVGNPTLYTMT